MPLPLQQVGAIEPGGAHVNEHLSCRRLRHRTLDQDQGLRIAGRRHIDRAHGLRDRHQACLSAGLAAALP